MENVLLAACLTMPLKGRKISWNAYLCVLLAVSCTITLYKAAFPVFVDLKDRDLLDLKKCPACYGVNMCPAILTGDIRLIDWSQYTIRRFINARNIYFGTYKNKPVVMKKLAHDWELQELDKKICNRANFMDNCPVEKAMRILTRELTEAIFVPDIGGGPGGRTEYRIRADKMGNGSDFLHCSSTRKTQFIMDKVLKRNHGQNQITIIENMLTLMMINEETLLVQAFPEEDGFPFPKYYGACGRLAIEELVNKTIADYAYAEWETRAAIGYKLLELANTMVNISDNFSLYWTDVTEHNIGVDSNKKLKILDAENIIMVDLEEVEKMKHEGWDVPYNSEGVGCEDCFSFSVDDLCDHRETDHNIYALCHGLLSPGAFSHVYPQGLLYDIPDYVLSQYPELPRLLQECKLPKLSGGRFEAAEKLQKILANFEANLADR